LKKLYKLFYRNWTLPFL